MTDYRVEFTATSSASIAPDARDRLATALAGMPGANGVEATAHDRRRRRVTAAFWIEVRLGMADAARDGSRLAKEALKVAGMGEAQLVELSVAMGERPASVDGGAPPA
ncbi:hypothetical protein [Miltoncostaea marina]|uniref:hypothetical protein n=1 Tax=Miltoncostaea marina TaxID=2843215 RepID=UPI001C3C46C3|nr:hypothetical protein [Miltoncostaea marina]